jgi:hypothetical protein
MESSENAQDRAARYRREAKACLEVADRVSLRSDRVRMMEMAEGWLQLARKAEAEAEGGAP